MISFYYSKADKPPQILDLTALDCSSHVRLSSMKTPRAFDLGTRLISVPFNNSASEITICLILREWHIVMHSVLAGL